MRERTPSSKDQLRATLKAAKLGGARHYEELSHWTALHTLDEDLGRYPDMPLTDYGLNDATRDRLIANARQDAAQALINTLYIAKCVRSIELTAVLTFWLVVAALLWWAFR